MNSVKIDDEDSSSIRKSISMVVEKKNKKFAFKLTPEEQVPIKNSPEKELKEGPKFKRSNMINIMEERSSMPSISLKRGEASAKFSRKKSVRRSSSKKPSNHKRVGAFATTSMKIYKLKKKKTMSKGNAREETLVDLEIWLERVQSSFLRHYFKRDLTQAVNGSLS